MGIRVPCVVKWPGRIRKGGYSQELCMTMDFTRSIARIGGARAPKDRPFDGIDILRDTERNMPLRPKRTLFWRARRGLNTRKAVRDGDLKYIHLRDDQAVTEHLFDLKADPAEKTNLIATRTADADRLRALLADWERDVRHSR